MTYKLGRLCISAGSVAAVILGGCRTDNAPSQSTSSIQHPAPTTQSVAGSSSAGDEVVARFNGLTLTRRELDQPLIDAFGLKMMLALVQLDLAKQAAAGQGIHVTPADVQRERDLTFSKMFTDAPKSDYDALFQQFLNQQNLTQTQFDLVVEANTYLRKIAEPQLAGKISDAQVRQAFNQIYGENRQIRDIELVNMVQVAQARARLAQGDSFDEVARAMSRDRRTAANGGELPPFSLQSLNVPDAIKKAAFDLKVNEVSPDAIMVGSTYHVIKLINIIEPKIVKFEDVKAYVRKQMEDQWMEVAIKSLHNQLGQLAVQTMHIEDPVLAAQWKEKLEESQTRTRDKNEVLDEMERRRREAATQATTQPTTTTAPVVPSTHP